MQFIPEELVKRYMSEAAGQRLQVPGDEKLLKRNIQLARLGD